MLYHGKPSQAVNPTERRTGPNQLQQKLITTAGREEEAARLGNTQGELQDITVRNHNQMEIVSEKCKVPFLGTPVLYLQQFGRKGREDGWILRGKGTGTRSPGTD